jgi:hypothetical protein
MGTPVLIWAFLSLGLATVQANALDHMAKQASWKVQPQDPVEEPFGPRSIRNFYLACTSHDEQLAFCMIYLVGVADTLTAFGNGGHKGGICDADYTPEQLREIFVSWAKMHEDLSRMDMLAGISLALREQWPCR